jgi:signal transduction histidine kinase
MGIVGFAHHLCDHVEPGTPAKHYLQRIQELADRATMVASGLLTFSRQHTREPRDVVVDQLLGRVCPMWAELVGEDSRFDFTLNSDGAVVHVDPGQMEQALLNLVLNAREAMPQRGDLTIASRRAAPEGPVLITVRDTGVGMDGETLKRAFEPFFTTKPPDKGGGLGLPVVHGIVTAHGGTVAIESAPGKGTTVTISLPLARGAG